MSKTEPSEKTVEPVEKYLITRFISTPQFHLLLLAVIGVALYFFTLPYPFVYDDRILLMQNPLIKSNAGFLDLFDYNEFVEEYLPRLNDADMVSSFALRPIAYITFRINYLLGGTDPSGYRVVNIAIHIANAVMLYLFLRRTLRFRNEQQNTDTAVVIPLFASLLFLVHPLQTESVTYITQRFTSLGTSFYLATMLLYLTSITSRSRKAACFLYIGSLATLLAGMLTKEFLFTVPVSLLLMSVILLQNSLLKACCRLLPHLACLGLVPLLVVVVSEDLSGNGGIASATKIVNFSGFSSLEYAITQLRVILSYFRLLVLPYGLNFDPDYPLFRSITHPEILLSIAIWGIFLAFAIALLRRSARSVENDLVLFSLIWFPLLLSVSSTVIPLPDLMSEHRTYLPSLAFCTGLTTGLYSIRRRFRPEWGPRIAFGFCLIVALFGTLTVQRNFVYSSRLSLWSDTALKSPMKARPALALGNIYQEMNQADKAVEWLSKAILLNPDYIEPYLSLGSLFQDLSMPDNAIALYESWLASHPPDTRLLSNLALAYQVTGRPLLAIESLKTAMKLDPDDEMLKIILAEHLFMLGRNREANTMLVNAEKLDESNPLADYSDTIEVMERYYGKIQATMKKHTGKVES